MQTLNDFLDEVKAKAGTDYRAARAIGVSTALYGNWRGLRSMPSNKHVLMLCDTYQISLDQAIRAIEWSRENERPMREAGFADVGLLGSIAGGMSLTLVTAYALYPSIGAALGAGTLYIM